MENQINSRSALWPTILQVAILSALLATVLSSLSFVGLGALDAMVTKQAAFESVPTLWDVVKAAFLLCALTAVWYGPLGFLAGGVGGAILHFRRKRIHTLKRLVLEASALGVAVAVVLPFYALAMSRWLNTWHSTWFGLVVVLPLCVVSSVICALVFRRRLVEKVGTLLNSTSALAR
jgi:hypothetical protein